MNLNIIKRKEILILLIVMINLSFVFAEVVTNYPTTTTTTTTTYNNYNPSYSTGYNPSINTQYYNPSYSNNYNPGGSVNWNNQPSVNWNNQPSANWYGQGYSSTNYGSNYYNQYNPSIYWSSYGSNSCVSQQDVILQVVPGSCTPLIVRSDLLEEQNVPIFCKLAFVQTNPLVSLSMIRSLSFKGNYPKGVSGISYFPSQSALMNSQSGLQNNLVKDDLGFLVITLSQQTSEAQMPNFIEGDITAVIDYDTSNSFGIGNTNIYLSESDQQTSFWNGKGYIKADSIESDRATISISNEAGLEQTSITLRKGEISRDIPLGGSYCSAGFNIKLDDIGAPVDSALLKINDQKVWVARGDRIINDKCSVSDLRISSGGGKISISCPIQDGRFDLSLQSKTANFDINGESKSYSIGSQLDSNVYLAYVNENEKYAVLIKDEFSKTKSEFDSKEVYGVIDKVIKNNPKNLEEQIKTAVKEQYKKKLASTAPKSIDEKLEIAIVKEGSSGFGVVFDKILSVSNKDWSSETLDSRDVLALDYYEQAMKYYDDLASLYANEKMMKGDNTYAAVGLYEAAELSKTFGMNQRARDSFKKLQEKYADSSLGKVVGSENDLMMKYDTTNSRKSIILNNEQYSIDLLDFKTPSKADLSAALLINGKQEKLGLDEIRTLKQDGNGTSTVQIKEIKTDYVTVAFDKKGISKTERLNLADRTGQSSQTVFDGVNVKLSSISLDRQAKLSVLPRNFGPRTETSFRFRVEIEKRAIRLTPEQTQIMIDALKTAIQIWSSFNTQLGNVIRAMKASCFLTSTSLTIDNYFSKLSGETTARNDLMTGSGGWNKVCEELVNQKKYPSLQLCLLDKNSEIEKDIQIYSAEVKKTEQIISNIEKTVGKDYNKIEAEFKKNFDDFCKNARGDVKLSTGESVSFSGENGVCSWKNLTHQQRKEIMTLYNLRNSGSSSLKDVVNKKLTDSVTSAKNFEKESSVLSDSNKDNKNLGIKTTIPEGEKTSLGDIKTIGPLDSGNNIYKNFKQGDNVIRVFIPYKKVTGSNQFTAHSEVAGKEVIIQVQKIEGSKGDYTPKGKIYTTEGKEIIGDAEKSVREYLSFVGMDRVKQESNKAYENPMKNPSQLRVKYFDKAPFKGFPSEIPFDVEKGWYVEFTYILSGFGRPYDDSGRAVNYYICNVGENGLIEFKQSADDICRYYNKDTGASLDFPGLTRDESLKLVSQAEKAIAEAKKQYGKDRVSVNGKTFGSGSSFGGEVGKCTDFMSPQKCNLLFNVCDPVICPPSRCDLGGRYKVDNVIQSGIIGGLTLCLPNINEGIAIPICLTGVHAGIEGFLSIMNSTVDCLEENLKTGRNVGICDEIKSVYLCEFFWKQSLPLTNVLTSNFNGIYSLGTRGGGEYANINNAYGNTQGAVDYFKNQYTSSSSQAFSSLSIDSASFQVCNAFMSSGFSNTSGLFSGVSNAFNQMIEPDSPPQYHGWFSENVLTTATIPPMSHYKVYYHIFAGNGIIAGYQQQGVSYTVYLKSSSTSGLNIGNYVVASGYLAPGRSADESRDFTAPSGYKQLCIVVNGKEECGFSQVSTSYYMDSLSDAYVQEQLNANVKTESECIAGTPSSNVVQLNQMQAITESTQPSIYNRGIIRVCASNNPGKQVTNQGTYDVTNSTSDRWKIVGYCGDTNIKCWLDTESVKTAITDKGIQQQVLDKVNLGVLGQNQYWTEEQSISVAENVEKFISNLVIYPEDTREIVEGKIKAAADDLIKLSNLGINNNYRARGLYLLGHLHGKVAQSLKKTPGENGTIISGTTVEVGKGEIISDETTSTGTASTSDTSQEFKDYTLRNNVAIRVDYLNAISYIYKYSGVRWISDDSEFAAKNLGYMTGLEEIIRKTNMKCKIVIESKVIDCSSFKTSDTLLEEIMMGLKN